MALAKIIESIYGVNPVQCDLIVIEWAATKALEKDSASNVAKEWKALNRKRSRLGIITANPPYGHPCFGLC